jgi:hypothetical protein
MVLPATCSVQQNVAENSVHPRAICGYSGPAVDSAAVEPFHGVSNYRNFSVSNEILKVFSGMPGVCFFHGLEFSFELDNMSCGLCQVI